MRPLLLFAALSASQFALAESLPDPTRPAIDLGTGGTGVEIEAGAAQAERPTRGLQSIIISPEYKVAVINGQTVRLGEMYAGAKLVEIREGSIVLRGAQGTRVMELFPKVFIQRKKALPQTSGNESDDAAGADDLPGNAAGGEK